MRFHLVDYMYSAEMRTHTILGVRFYTTRETNKRISGIATKKEDEEGPTFQKKHSNK